jgi:hypothetical protein
MARSLRTAGMPLETLKILLGHKDGDITTHHSAPELPTAMRVLQVVRPNLRQQEKLAPSGQRARERFGDVPADEGFAQHVADAGGMCAFGEPRTAVAAHENYGNVGP